jgi:hypothetical protein
MNPNSLEVEMTVNQEEGNWIFYSPSLTQAFIISPM